MKAVSLATQREFFTFLTLVNGRVVEVEKAVLTEDDMPSGVLAFPVPDSTDLIEGSSDATKILRIEVDGFTTATTRTMTIPDASFTVAGLGIANIFTTIQTVDLSSDVKGLIVQASASQTANLLETQTSAGAALTRIASDGAMTVRVPAGSTDLLNLVDNATSRFRFYANGVWEFKNSFDVSGLSSFPGGMKFSTGGVVGFNSSANVYLKAHDDQMYWVRNHATGTGTPHILIQAKSSTTADRNVASIDTPWSDSTDASRAGRIIHAVYYITTSQEFLRATAGSAGVDVIIGNDITFHGLVVNEGQADADFFFKSQNDPKLLCGDAATDNVGIGIHPPTVKLHVNDHDTNTTTVVRSMIVELDSSNTPGVGFGTELAFLLEDDTNPSKDAASIYASWLNATTGSQRASLVLSAYYITTAQEGFRIDGTKGGCIVTIGNDANYGGLVINEGSADADTRIESNGNTHAIFVDAGNDRVGIMNSSPSTAFHVTGAVTVSGATAGATAFSVSSTATNDDPNYIIRQTRVATTDATVTTIDTITIAASTTYMIEARVVARRTGGAAGAADDGAAYVRTCLVTTKSSVVTVTGTTSVVTQEDQAGWDVTFAVSGSTILIQVTGAADNSVVWHCTAIIQNVGT